MNPSPRAQQKTNRSNANINHGRRWLPMVGALVLLGLIVFGLWPKPVPVETARVCRGALRVTVNEEGRTRVRHRYVVAATISGQLRRMTLNAGDPVEAGKTTVAVIDPMVPVPLDARARASAEARHGVALANVAKAQAAHSFNETELARFEKLFKEGAIAVQELDAMRFRVVSSGRELAAAESALKQVEAELTDFANRRASEGGLCSGEPVEMTAPATGRILRVFQESARVVSAGTPLLEIGDPSDLEVVIEVLSRDGAAIAPGTPVFLEQWGRGEPLKARVRLVEPAAFTKVSALGVEEQRVNVIADILTPPDQRRGLGDGFRVEARIVLWESPDVLKVPAGALFRRAQRWHAFVLMGSRAVLRAVEVGRLSGVETQVLDGLNEGESVILYPGDRVRDGQRVRQITI